MDYLLREGFDVRGPGKRRWLTVSFLVPSIVRALARRGNADDVVEIHEPVA